MLRKILCVFAFPYFAVFFLCYTTRFCYYNTKIREVVRYEKLLNKIKGKGKQKTKQKMFLLRKFIQKLKQFCFVSQFVVAVC